MKKIPTVFERDWDGDRSRVVNQVHPGCEWVLDGEGDATRKYDGTSCAVIDGKLYKRFEAKNEQFARKPAPLGSIFVDCDATTLKSIFWVPVGDGPEDKWHREAFTAGLPDGTYELLGPKAQGNAEQFLSHILFPHRAAGIYHDAPRTFDGLREWFAGKDIEGLVFHHPDGRMAKIKQRDFGLKRGVTPEVERLRS